MDYLMEVISPGPLFGNIAWKHCLKACCISWSQTRTALFVHVVFGLGIYKYLFPTLTLDIVTEDLIILALYSHLLLLH